MRTGITIALALGAAAVVALLVRSGDGGPEPEPGGDGTMSTKPKPLYVGTRGDPELEALLIEMDDVFASAGIRDFSAPEVTKMRKTPGPSYAIPPRSHWPRMVKTLQKMQEIRDDWGRPIKVYNGFRPEDYNKAVGGAPGSRHQWNEAVDVLPEGDREAFAKLLALHYTQTPDMALGIYGNPGSLNGFHVDMYRKRNWGVANHYIRQVGTA